MNDKPRFKLLIVDDEMTERKGLGYLIRQNEYPFEISEAANGREALALLRREPFDLMLADVKMPLMDGLTLCGAAKQLCPSLLMIIISAYGDFEYTQKAIKLRVDDYLLKPVDVQEFRRAIEDALDALHGHSVRAVPDDQQDILRFRQEKSMAEYLDDLDSGEQENGRRLIQEVTDLIRQHYSEDIGLEWLAKRVYLSGGYLSGLFKRATGKSVVQTITMQRMERAKELLETTNMKIIDVAEMVGYGNVSYFCLLFKKYYGLTAIEAREGKGAHG